MISGRTTLFVGEVLMKQTITPLLAASEGVRVRLQRRGKLSVLDGPFTETKEVIGGYAILASSRFSWCATAPRFQ